MNFARFRRAVAAIQRMKALAPRLYCSACAEAAILDDGRLCAKRCGRGYLIPDRRALLDADRRRAFPSDIWDRESERRGTLARRENERDPAEAET